jgi:hypothetical protein
LPVSQKILREHGGDIRVSSTPDVGSRFSLEFPAIATKAEGEHSEGGGLDTLTGSLPQELDGDLSDDVTEDLPPRGNRTS